MIKFRVPSCCNNNKNDDNYMYDYDNVDDKKQNIFKLRRSDIQDDGSNDVIWRHSHK